MPPESPQQQETQAYFRRYATEWRTHAEAHNKQFSLRIERDRLALEAAPRSGVACDLGCGSGELAHRLAERGLEVLGLDFAPEMIEIARRTPSSAKFVCASLLDFAFDDESVDFFVANGLIEYFSPEEVEFLFRKAARALRPGGSLVVHVRNRLFNLFSLNEYTRRECAAGTLARLAEEAVLLAGGAGFEALARLPGNLPRFSSHPPTTSEGTTIAVQTRHQYLPSESILSLARAGLFTEKLLPLHFHAFPGPVRDAHPEWHDQAAALVQRELPLSAIPQCSSFVAIARKEKS